MPRKWTEAQRAKFKATMAARRDKKSFATATKKATKRSAPHRAPSIVYQLDSHGRLRKLRLRTIRVYMP